MSIKLTDAQIFILSAAAQRDDRCLIAPRNLKGGAAQKVAAKLIAGGLAKEIKAKPGAPVWRQDEQTGLRVALKITAAGLRAIAVEDRSALDDTRADGGERVQVAASSEIIRPTTLETPATDARRRSAPRDGTKLAQLVELLQRDQGATIAELVAASDVGTARTSRPVISKPDCSKRPSRHGTQRFPPLGDVRFWFDRSSPSKLLMGLRHQPFGRASGDE